MTSALKILLFFVFYFVLCFSTRMIPERAILEYYDEKYVQDVLFNVRRYGRKSGYYINLEGTILHTWGDNISMHIVLYEFLHNEYKRTFVEFHFDHLCEMVKSDQLIGKTFTNAGIQTCPLQPKHYIVANMSLPLEKYPYKWPFERAKAQMTFLCNNTVLSTGSLYMRFVEK